MSTAELERLSSPRVGRSSTVEQQSSRRERRHLEVVPEPYAADDVAALFTAVRPCDGAGVALARRGATQFDARASVTAWILSDGLRRLAAADRERVLDSWRSRPREDVGVLVTDGGCAVGIGGVEVRGPLRLALLRWLPLAGAELAVYESGLFRDTPADALTLLLRPPTIWSMVEAAAAERLRPRSAWFEPERFEHLERHAHGCVRRTHLARLREAARRIERQLPVAGLPVASATVAAGWAVLETDDAVCRSIAARQLARYAASAWVARETGEGS